MDIRHIRYLVSAVDGGSLSSAAKQQFVTVQAVSKGISELEAEVGTPLLIRSNHGVKPTAVGQGFYNRARRILDSFNELEAFSDRVTTQHSRERLLLSFCAPPFEGGDVAMKRLADIVGAKLGIEIEILIAPGKTSLESLRAGTVDALCMIGSYSAPDTDCISIGSLPTGVGMTKDHPLARRKTLRLADISPYPIIWSESFDSFNRSICTVYQERGLTAPIVRINEDGTCDPADTDLTKAVYFSVYLSPFGQPFRESRVVPIDASEAISIPICLVTLKTTKSEAYLKLEQQLRSAFKLTSLLHA